MNQMPGWVSVISIVSQGVLLLLIGLSIYSVSILLDRRKKFQKFLPTTSFKDLQKKVTETGSQDHLTFYDQAIEVLLNSPQNADSIHYSMKAFITKSKIDFQKGFSVLGTLGSNAPFIGLFGTVLGIIKAFAQLSLSTDGMNSVLFSLAEALIATAVGLFVAIPAVISYNYFSTRWKNAVSMVDSIKDEYIAHQILGKK